MSCPKCDRNSVKEEYPGHFRCKVCSWIGPQSELKGTPRKAISADPYMLRMAISGTILMALGLGMIYASEGWVKDLNCDTDAKPGFADDCKQIQPLALGLATVGKILLPIVAVGAWIMAFVGPRIWKEEKE